MQMLKSRCRAPGTGSWISWLASLPTTNRKRFVESLDAEELRAFENDWTFQARPEQLPPDGDWLTWLILSGRGWGKTRTGAEFVIEEVRAGRAPRVHLVGRSAADVRDVMIDGESGILACSPDDFRPAYEPSKRRLTWPNGAVATTFSADQPSQLRGPQCYLVWCDELAAWRYPEAWDQVLFGLRLGKHPRAIVTTTPRPRRFLQSLAKNPTTVITRGSTRDNLQNLSSIFIETIFDRYQGTSMGAQELEGALLDEIPGAIFTRAAIEGARVKEAPALARIVVAVDPAVTSNAQSDESGIVVAGVSGSGDFYVLEDASFKGTPDRVVKKSIDLYHKHRADRVVFEKNQGGDTWKSIANQIDPRVVPGLIHASRGKHTRAEPVAARYEQGKVHHVGRFDRLEDQMVNFLPGSNDADDRLDAMVWAITQLDTRTGPAFNLDLGGLGQEGVRH
jgi:predicted phage terminase large subunit-like protein